MALSEPQIQRYSRQILLREVGGIGQRRLLSSSVEVVAEGPAFETAGRYLAAGGTPVRGLALAPFDPELDASLPVSVRIASGAASGEGARILLGAGAHGAVRIAWRAADGCGTCFERLVTSEASIDGVQATTAGALMALGAQRLILGTLTGVGGIELSPDGELRTLAPDLCAEHR